MLVAKESNTMDEFTKRMLDLDKEQKEHPERFHLHFTCKKCGRQWESPFPKEEVERWITGHGQGTRNVTVQECEKCGAPDEDDE